MFYPRMLHLHLKNCHKVEGEGVVLLQSDMDTPPPYSHLYQSGQDLRTHEAYVYSYFILFYFLCL
jgi:polygalacturonase